MEANGRNGRKPVPPAIHVRLVDNQLTNRYQRRCTYNCNRYQVKYNTTLPKSGSNAFLAPRLVYK